MMDAEANIKVTSNDIRSNVYVFGALDKSQSRYEASIDAGLVTLYVDLEGDNVINTVEFVSASVDKAVLTVLLNGDLIERWVFIYLS